MRTCILGGTGNISSSFLPLLLELGHEVTIVNRGQSKPAEGKSLPKGVRAVVADRKDRAAFERRVQAERFDYAIDMICYHAEDAQSTLRAFKGVKHLVHCSTVCTYGVEYDWFPTTEDHPLRPITDYGRGKVAADRVLLEAFYREGFPVTVIKPSTTFGPKWPMLRQVAWEAGWVDRVRKGKPIVVCGDGGALHQFLYVDDAAPAFVFPLGRERCVGQTYHMVKRGFTTWAQYHRAAMKVIGREVELVGVPLANLEAAAGGTPEASGVAGTPDIGICKTIFAHSTYYSPDRLMRDVPEFAPKVSLEEGLSRVLAAMEREGHVPDSDKETWEDTLIAQQRAVGRAAGLRLEA